MPEGRAAIQRDNYRPGKSASGNLMQSKRDKCKALHLERRNSLWYRGWALPGSRTALLKGP